MKNDYSKEVATALKNIVELYKNSDRVSGRI